MMFFYFFCVFCFVHPIFRFWFLVTFGDKVMKIQKSYIIFVYILQGKMGKTEKTKKKIMQLKGPKYQTKRQKYGMNETKFSKIKHLSNLFFWKFRMKSQVYEPLDVTL